MGENCPVKRIWRFLRRQQGRGLGCWTENGGGVITIGPLRGFSVKNESMAWPVWLSS